LCSIGGKIAGVLARKSGGKERPKTGPVTIKTIPSKTCLCGYVITLFFVKKRKFRFNI
jgi:hypothetical protein